MTGIRVQEGGDGMNASTANYDSLTAVQQPEFDRLMSIPVNQWPAELVRHVRDTGGSFCGDALADAVAGWVRRQS